MSDPILVVGGAGFIGSHVARQLQRTESKLYVLDNLQGGYWQTAAKLGLLEENRLIVGDVRDRQSIDNAMNFIATRERSAPESVLHFAARIEVAESTQYPNLYFQTNTDGTKNLLASMAKFGVENLVFSSTAATYGNPSSTDGRLTEESPTRPINPYGESKLRAELAIRSAVNDGSIRSAVALRYFNASGCSQDGALGEMHQPETHLIPRAIMPLLDHPTYQKFTVFGSDFETPDGTCVRDYIHVEDLADAHQLALIQAKEEPGWRVYNLGSGRGYSNKEVVEQVYDVLGADVRTIGYGDRRDGDPAILIADPARAVSELGWSPQYSLTDIVTDAVNFLDIYQQHKWQAWVDPKDVAGIAQDRLTALENHQVVARLQQFVER
ncbi:MAG: UDP-glucose 4-epimerase GalE [Holosporaceae bacterium]|jgi:UDP-glucose 4-epimerase|nr:UDP-glucose 4-epimerase GalE [Rhodospirillaceae bacterium]